MIAQELIKRNLPDLFVVDGKEIIMEIPNLYIPSFKKEEFENNYSQNNSYTFVAFCDDYNKNDILPIIGLKNNTDVLLDEELVLRAISFNVKTGLAFSSVFVVIGLISFGYMLWSKRFG